MSRGVNKMIALGNLGRDPETRYVPDGSAVTNFPVAMSESWKDKQTGEIKERTEWLDVEVWGKMAENCAEYLRKGSQVYCEGSLRTDSWDDKDTGQKRYRTKLRANVVNFLSRAQGDGQPGGRPPSPGRQQGGATHTQDFDDDIPF